MMKPVYQAVEGLAQNPYGDDGDKWPAHNG
jgi:hypothetical protein